MVKIKLFDLLLRLDINQRKLAKLTEIRPNTINAYCRETIKRIEIQDLDKLCKTLNCQISDLLEYKGDELI